MRIDYAFSAFTIASSQLLFIPKAEPFQLRAEGLIKPNLRPRSRVVPLNFRNGDHINPSSDNKLLFVNATQPTYVASLLTPAVSPQRIVESDREALTAALDAALHTLEAVLSDCSVTVEGRVKSDDSQLGKRLKLKLASRVGEQTLAQICKRPHMEKEIRSLVRQYWFDLNQTTLEDIPLNDIIGVRVIHDNEHSESCYQIFKRIINAPEVRESYRFDETTYRDYIKHQKENGYQSLHGSLILRLNPAIRVELQVRNRDMHHTAEHGSAKHNTYKALPSTILKLFREEQRRLCFFQEIPNFALNQTEKPGLRP